MQTPLSSHVMSRFLRIGSHQYSGVSTLFGILPVVASGRVTAEVAAMPPMILTPEEEAKAMEAGGT